MQLFLMLFALPLAKLKCHHVQHMIYVVLHIKLHYYVLKVHCSLTFKMPTD